MMPFANTEYRVDYREIAREARDTRAKRARMARDLRKHVDNETVRHTMALGYHYQRPGGAYEYKTAWDRVVRYEVYGVQLSHLPCGADDAAWERAMHRYNAALAVIREYGRPLP